jgi:hypothetical protein
VLQKKKKRKLKIPILVSFLFFVSFLSFFLSPSFLLSFFFHGTVCEFIFDCLFNSGPCAYKESTLPLEPCLQPFLFRVICHIGSHAFAKAGLGLRSSYLCFPYSWDDINVPPYPAFFLRWGLPFSPGWPQTSNLPISASWEAVITEALSLVFLNTFFFPDQGFEFVLARQALYHLSHPYFQSFFFLFLFFGSTEV